MDTSTILNPPRIDWEDEWASLGHRAVQVIWWEMEARKALQDTQNLHSGVAQQLEQRKENNISNAELVAKITKELAMVRTLHAQIPQFESSQIDHLHAMLESMKEYALHLHGIFPWHFKQKLTRSRRYSPSHVNRTLLRQISTDLRIAEQAIGQRLPQKLDDKLTLMWQGHLLYLSDLMAYDVLQPLKDADIVPQNTAILTYMQRQTDIRMVPYYNAVLLGFPSATANKSTTPPSEFLAIPHEIGHYLYRHGTLSNIPKEAKSVISALAEAYKWPKEIVLQLEDDSALIGELTAALKEKGDEGFKILTKQEKVREIHRAISQALTRLAQAEQAAHLITSKHIEQLLWKEPIALMKEVQDALPEFRTPEGQERDQPHELAQALHKVLRQAMGIDESVHGDLGALRRVLNLRTVDILEKIEKLKMSMPEPAPGTSTWRGIHQLLIEYLDTIAPEQPPVSVPTLELNDIRRVLTPRVYETLETKLEQLHILPTDWRRHWLEEIFCDAYGCLLAGPANVLGFQKILSDEQYEHEHQSRGKHPTSSLRPFIQSEMLREMDRRGTAVYKHAPDLLDTHWQYHLAQYGDHDHQRGLLQTLYSPEGQTPALTGQQIIDALQIVIDQIFDLYAEIFHQDATAQTLTDTGEKRLTVPWTIWTSDIPEDLLPRHNNDNKRAPWNAMLHLQNQFEEYYSTRILTQKSSVPHFKKQKWDKTFLGSYTELSEPIPPSIADTPTMDMLRAQKLHTKIKTNKYTKNRQVPVAEWFEVFAVEGWSTEGPEASDDQ